jgi:ribosomal protein S18 acetylase RimI-like enzyme
MIELRQADTPAAIMVIRDLLLEYERALGIDLCFQNFTTELAILPGDYAPPRGGLLLGWEGDIAIGCVAMRPLNETTCEMKRLYVRPLFRTNGIGRRLVERMVKEASTAGYHRMYLDTLPSMTDAQRLYESLRFREIPPYRHNPIPGARFLGLDLRPLHDD